MYPNKESGLGAKLATAVFDNAMLNNPTTGRVFIVAKAALANISEIKALYGNNYPDGTPIELVFRMTLSNALAYS